MGKPSLVTLTSRDATDRQRIVIDFICSTLDGYESCTGIFLSTLHSRIYTRTHIQLPQISPHLEVFRLLAYTHYLDIRIDP